MERRIVLLQEIGLRGVNYKLMYLFLETDERVLHTKIIHYKVQKMMRHLYWVPICLYSVLLYFVMIALTIEKKRSLKRKECISMIVGGRDGL